MILRAREMWKEKFLIDGKTEVVVIDKFSLFREAIDASTYQDSFRTYLPGVLYLELVGVTKNNLRIDNLFRVVGRKNASVISLATLPYGREGDELA